MFCQIFVTFYNIFCQYFVTIWFLTVFLSVFCYIFVFCHIFDSFWLDYCHILKMAGPTFNKSTPISYFGGPFPPPLHSLCIASCASQKVPGHKQCQGSTKHCFFSPYGMEGGGVQEVRKFTPTNRNGMWRKQNWLSLSRHYHRCGYYT